MNDACREFERLLPALLEGRATAAHEGFLREHLGACSSCRDAAIGREPSLLLLELGNDTRDEVYWARFWRDLQPGLDQIDRERSERPASRNASFAALLAAGSGLAAGLLLALIALRWAGAPPADPSSAPGAVMQAEGAREYYYEVDGAPVVFIVDRDMDL